MPPKNNTSKNGDGVRRVASTPKTPKTYPLNRVEGSSFISSNNTSLNHTLHESLCHESDGDEDLTGVGVDVSIEKPKEEAVPPKLLTHLLHEFFKDRRTRITTDANVATAKYVDVFIRETIARTAVERSAGFLEVSLTCKF